MSHVGLQVRERPKGTVGLAELFTKLNEENTSTSLDLTEATQVNISLTKELTPFYQAINAKNLQLKTTSHLLKMSYLYLAI